MKKPMPQFDPRLEEICIISIETATKENPVKAKTLRQIYGDKTKEWVHIRRVQEAVQSLRLRGFPICANAEGYYWPGSSLELVNYIDGIKQRVSELNKMLEAVMQKHGSINISAEAVIEAE